MGLRPTITSFTGTLPSTSDPENFPARADAALVFVQDVVPEMEALGQWMEDRDEDSALGASGYTPTANNTATTISGAVTQVSDKLAETNLVLARQFDTSMDFYTNTVIAAGDFPDESIVKIVADGITLKVDQSAASPYATVNGVNYSRVFEPTFASPQHSVGGLHRLIRDMSLSPTDAGGGSISFDTLQFPCLGSSVWVGASTGGEPIDAFIASFQKYFDIQGIGNAQKLNLAVNGSVINDGDVNWDTIRPSISANFCLLGYGMNDQGVSAFNAGQSFPGFYRAARRLALRMLKDGITPIFVTTPHRRTSGPAYELDAANDMNWPAFINAPVAASQIWPAPADSIVTVPVGGTTATADFRALQINQAMRNVASEIKGCMLIDAEPYWLEAVSVHGEDALYDGPEFVHPNLLGHQLSYHRAFEDAMRLAAHGTDQGDHFGGAFGSLVAGIDPISFDDFTPDALLTVRGNSNLYDNAFQVNIGDADDLPDVTYRLDTDTNNISVEESIYTSNRAASYDQVTTRERLTITANNTYQIPLPSSLNRGMGKLLTRSFTNTGASVSIVEHLVAMRAGIVEVSEVARASALISPTEQVPTFAGGPNSIEVTAPPNNTTIAYTLEWIAL